MYDITEDIPFKTNEEISRFMSQDYDFKNRSQSLLNYMLVRSERSSIGKFASTMVDGVFHKFYMANHRWPAKK